MLTSTGKIWRWPITNNIPQHLRKSVLFWLSFDNSDFNDAKNCVKTKLLSLQKNMLILSLYYQPRRHDILPNDTQQNRMKLSDMQHKRVITLQ
jgi:hypothetical protein